MKKLRKRFLANKKMCWSKTP